MEALKSLRVMTTAIIAAFIASAASASGASAATVSVAASPATAADYTGFWEVRPRPGAVPPAKVTPEARALVAKLNAERQAVNGPVSPEGRWCKKMGVPFIMGSSPPLFFLQHKDVIVILAEQTSSPRFIYLDGRDFPDQATFDETTNGFSVGRFEGDTLVVETRYFAPDKGTPFIPGGALKTTQTRLVERMRMSEGGQRLTIQFTWTDPQVFLEPHTYELNYERSPAGTIALENWCDASDPAQRALAEEPEQQP